MRQVIFRPAALAKLSSPDKLDEAVRVTSSRAWLGLGVAGLLLLAILVWSVVGTIEDSVSGAGVIVRGAGLSEIAAVEGGEILDIRVKPGDQILAGDVVASIRRPSSPNRDLNARMAGKVVEVLAVRGSVLPSGGAIATIEPSDGELEALVFVPAAVAKGIKPGMPVDISPSTAGKEQFGLLKGEVESVSSFPVSPKSVVARLGNEQLVRQLLGTAPAGEVRVQLLPDTATASGFQWTSRSGPPFAISSGTLATAELVVSERRPISLVLPFVR